jgi:hypothetical protein
MARILSLFVLPLLAIAVFSLYLPDSPKAKKVVHRVARVITGQPAPEEEADAAIQPATVYEQLAVPSVNLGPEYAQQPELRIWAIRNDTTYGWIQLPRGTPVHLLRQDGDYSVVRYEETVIRVHRSVVEAGLLTPKKLRTYAVAY